MTMGLKTAVFCATAAAAAGTAGFVYEKIESLNEHCNYYELGSLPVPSHDAEAATETNICPIESPNCDAATAIATLYSGANMIPVTIEQIPDKFENLVTATEWQPFYYRNTVDGIEVAQRIVGRGLQASISELSPQLPSGGSDIVMQLVRNYAPAAMPQNDICRKIFEITAGQKLLDLYSGEADENGRYAGNGFILQEYANIVNVGRGARGYEAGAWAYFGRDLSSLTFIEWATLAGIPQSPNNMDGDSDPAVNERNLDRLQARRDIVLQSYINEVDNLELPYGSLEDRAILKADRQAEVEAGLALQPNVRDYVMPYDLFNQAPRNDYSVAAGIGAQHFVEDIIEDVMAKMELDNDELRDGLNINTTLSMDIQRRTIDAINSVNWPRDGRQMAGVVLAQDGAIRALYGGDRAASEVNLATSRGPVGSSLKPYVYAHALETGAISGLDQVFAEENPFTWPGVNTNDTDWLVEEGSHCGNPAACDGYEALRKSSNPIPLQIARSMGQAGLDGIVADMRAYGMESNTPAIPALVLGWWETSAVDLAEGMNGIVANQGESRPAYSIVDVTRYTGTEFKRIDNGLFAPAAPRRILSAGNAAQITEALRGTVRDGTASRSISGIPGDIAGKTGSAPEDSVAVFTATSRTISGNLTFSFIMRNVAEPIPMQGDTVGGGFPAQVVGALVSPIADPNGRIN